MKNTKLGILSFIILLLMNISCTTEDKSSEIDGSRIQGIEQLRGNWFIEVSGVVPDGGKYQNIMNVGNDGLVDVVGGWMFGAGGVKFTDSPGSVVKIDKNNFEIKMFAFISDVNSGQPTTLNITVYRGKMLDNGIEFMADADLYYFPCTSSECLPPNMKDLGKPAVIAQVKGSKLAKSTL